MTLFFFQGYVTQPFNKKKKKKKKVIIIIAGLPSQENSQTDSQCVTEIT